MQDLKAIACPTAAVCEAVGGGGSGATILRSTDGGNAWASQSLPSGVSELTGVACASTRV